MPNTASASVLPLTCAIPQSSRVIVTRSVAEDEFDTISAKDAARVTRIIMAKPINTYSLSVDFFCAGRNRLGGGDEIHCHCLRNRPRVRSSHNRGSTDIRCP